MSDTARITIIPDTQIPYQNHRALAAVIRYIGDTQPEVVLHIGDLMDFPGPSRWSRGTAEEFVPRVKKDCDIAKRKFFEPLRDVYDGPILFHEGNHDLRPRVYLAKYAPALADSNAFGIDTLLDFDGFGVTLLPEFYKIAPKWYTTHGHMGKIPLSKDAGVTARNAAKKMNASVVMGHTHRMGLIPHTYGVGGQIGGTVWGMEVGNMMAMKKASYLDSGTANWQTGFAELRVSGTHVTPVLAPIIGGKFMVDGDLWKV